MYTFSSPEGPVRPRCISLLSLASVFVLVSPLKAGNPPAASQTDPPVYKTHAREVVVDVVVSKGSDEAVTGLRARDFVVMEDGKLQTVDYFEEHTARTLPAGATQPLPPMPAGVYTNVPPAPEGDAVNVLLLDSLNTDQQDQTYVHGQIMNFLKSMQPGTKVAIFTLSSQLRMVQGFTTDTSVLRDALNNPKYGVRPDKTPVSRSLSDKLDEKEDLARLGKMGAGPVALDALEGMQASAGSYQADQRVAMTLEALKYLGRYLAGVPGRKNLI
jgi:VWFA-related protein